MRHFLKPALACIIALAAAGFGTPAASADGIDHQNGKPDLNAKGWHTPLTIPAAGFRHEGADPEAFFFHPSGHIEAGGAEVQFFAPVYLPDGADVHRLTANIYDNTNGCSDPDITVYLRRTNLLSGTWYPMGYTLSSGASGSPQEISDTNIINSEIDNWQYVYYVFVNMCSSDHELMSVNIYYSE